MTTLADLTHRAQRLARNAPTSEWGPTVGFATVGVSLFAWMAVGPRLLGDQNYSLAAVAWTVVTLIGVGLLLPGETAFTRQLTQHTRPKRSLQWIVVALAVAAAGSFFVAAAVNRNPLVGNNLLWAAAPLAAIIGWSACIPARSRLAAQRRYTAYGVTLTSEAVTRLVATVAALLQPAQAGWWLAVGLAAPYLVAAATSWSLARQQPLPRHWLSTGEPVGVFVILVGVSCFIQVVTNTAPLAVQGHYPDPVAAGAYVSLTSYLRVPLMLTAGLQTIALVRAATAHHQHLPGPLHAIRGTLTTATVIATSTSAACLLILPLAMTVLYGHTSLWHWPTILVITATTIATIHATLYTQAAIGWDCHRLALLAWAAGAAVTTALLPWTWTSILGVSLAVAAGTVSAAGVLTVSLRRRETSAVWPVNAARRTPSSGSPAEPLQVRRRTAG